MVCWFLFKLFKVLITLGVFGDRDSLLVSLNYSMFSLHLEFLGIEIVYWLKVFFGFVFKHLVNFFTPKSL